jgi:hypothetical protein
MSVRRSFRVLALALATALSWSLWAECVAAAVSTPFAHMTCCKDGELTCAAHGSGANCCATDSARARQAVTTAKADPVHALTAVVAWAVVPELATLDSLGPLSQLPVSPPRLDDGPPPCISFSSLLI